MFRIISCLLSVFAVTWSQCIDDNRIVSVDCYKERAVVKVNQTRLGQVAVQAAASWSEFAGLALYPNNLTNGQPNFHDTIPPTVTSDELLYNMDFSIGWIVKSNKSATTVARELVMEVVWPLQTNGKAYEWIVKAECQFKNQNTLNLASALTVDSTKGVDSSVRVMEAKIQSPNKTIAEGEDVTFELRIPNTTNASPLNCGLATDSTIASSLTPGLSPAACYFWHNEVAVTSPPCPWITSSQSSFTVTYSAADNGNRLFKAKWKAFLPDGNPSELVAFCLMRVCANRDDSQCSTIGPPTGTRVLKNLVDGATWLSSIRQTFKVDAATIVKPATTTTEETSPIPTSPTSVKPTSPVLYREEEVCMKAEELGSAFGVPLALILILLVALVLLVCQINKKTKEIYAIRRPAVKVRSELMELRRPRAVQASRAPRAGPTRSPPQN